MLSRQLEELSPRNQQDKSAEGGTRTHTSLRRADFKSAASTIPPPRQKLEAASGFEPLNRGFADPRLNLLATPPQIALERKTRFELATSSLARRRSTAELLPPNYLSNMVPRRRFELLRAYAHHPLKMACLPIPPPRHWQGRQDLNPRPAVLETAALPTELHP